MSENGMVRGKWLVVCLVISGCASLPKPTTEQLKAYEAVERRGYETIEVEGRKPGRAALLQLIPVPVGFGELYAGNTRQGILQMPLIIGTLGFYYYYAPYDAYWRVKTSNVLATLEAYKSGTLRKRNPVSKETGGNSTP